MTKILTSESDGVAVWTMESDKGLNILGVDLFLEMERLADEAEADDGVRVIVITGSGRAFAAGVDVGDISNHDVEAGMRLVGVAVSLFRRLELLKKPVIAAVNGYAFGGGFEMALACDIRVASDDAVFCMPEVRLGIIPGLGGTQRLPQLIGAGAAKEIILTAERVSAEKALRIGLVNRVAGSGELMPVAKSVAEKIASNSPAAVALAKEAISRGLGVDFETGVSIEAALTRACYASEDRAEGMRAFFEKRDPVFVRARAHGENAGS
ncbi:MAG: enoyl-CoA hydratase/isomerase family protein [Synergistaceae bacterium]|nr:enoyl-CoA hydratase/isomerase family protein [Synergistaceae bacterium]